MKRFLRSPALLLVVIPLLLFWSTEESAHGSDSSQLIGKFVNFILLFGGLTFLLRKPLRRFLDTRAEEIRTAIEEAAELRSSAEANLAKVQSRLDEMAGEIQRIRGDAETDGKSSRDQILESARQDAEKVKRITSQEIEMMTRSGTKDIKRYIAELAVKKAAERLRQTITPSEQAAIIDKSIERLDRLYEKSNAD